MGLLKRRIVEGSIKNFLDNYTYKYPFYLKNLKSNIELSKKTIEFCRKFEINYDIYYQNEISVKESLALAYKIILSINPELANLFKDRLKDRTIIFREDAPYSYTTDEEGGIKIVIKNNNNISDAVSLVHEFFHIVHLEKSKRKFTDGEYNCYTETIGMMGEFYALLYLIDNRSDLKEDIKMYINEELIAMNIRGNNTLNDGYLIDIYINNGDLSQKSIYDYVIKNNLSKDYLNILKYKYKLKFYYDDYVRYIYSFPEALSLGYQLYNDANIKKNIINTLNDLGNMKFNEWEKKYATKYINSEEEIINNANILETWLYNTLYCSNIKRK